MSDAPEWFRRMFAGWSSNNAQGRESSPYRGIVDPGPQPSQFAQGRITDMPVQPGMTPVAPPGVGQIAPAPRRYPSYDYEAFDRAIAPHVGDGGITEGPNRNIDDETRMKALQWVLSQGR